jgi:hypothetical protein
MHFYLTHAVVGLAPFGPLYAGQPTATSSSVLKDDVLARLRWPVSLVTPGQRYDQRLSNTRSDSLCCTAEG